MEKRKICIVVGLDWLKETVEEDQVVSNLPAYKASLKKFSEVFEVVDPLQGCEKVIPKMKNCLSLQDQHAVDQFRQNWQRKIRECLRDEIYPLILLEGEDDTSYPMFKEIVEYCVRNRKKFYARFDRIGSGIPDKNLVQKIVDETKIFRNDEEIVNHFSGETISI
jgi:hypothetical protein